MNYGHGGLFFIRLNHNVLRLRPRQFPCNRAIRNLTETIKRPLKRYEGQGMEFAANVRWARRLDKLTSFARLLVP